MHFISMNTNEQLCFKIKIEIEINYKFICETLIESVEARSTSININRKNTNQNQVFTGLPNISTVQHHSRPNKKTLFSDLSVFALL